jgi:hypothetical protein
MPRNGKRKHVVIDLTQDDNFSPSQRIRTGQVGSSNASSSRVRSYASSPSFIGQGGTHVYRPAPASSQSSQRSTREVESSQRLSASQHDSELLDLTQDDDGPQLELYGTIGMNIRK